MQLHEGVTGISDGEPKCIQVLILFQQCISTLFIQVEEHRRE